MAIWYAFKNIAGGSVKPYAGDCPPFYDLKGMPWYDALVNNIPTIQQKVLALLAQKSMQLEEYYNAGLVDEGKWTSKAFLVWNMTKNLPGVFTKELFAYFKDIPGLVSLSVSVLNPGTHVKPHHGDTDATYRIHIPVVVPSGLPECGIKVDQETRPWVADEIICFCDAHFHEAWNNSDKTRIILIADVIKQEYLSRTRMICASVLSWLLLQRVIQMRIVSVLPRILHNMIAALSFVLSWPVFLLLQQKRAFS